MVGLNFFFFQLENLVQIDWTDKSRDTMIELITTTQNKLKFYKSWQRLLEPV